DTTEFGPTMAASPMPLSEPPLEEPVEVVVEDAIVESVAPVIAQAAPQVEAHVELKSTPAPVATSPNSASANSLLGSALMLGLAKTLATFIAIPSVLYAAFFIYMRRRRPAAEAVDEPRIVEPDLEQFAISDHEMKELLWGRLKFDEDLGNSSSEVSEGTTGSLSDANMGVESTSLKPLPKEVIEAASREFRLSSFCEEGISPSAEDDANVEDEELDDITLALRELDELGTRMLKTSKYGQGDVMAFALPDGAEETESASRRQSAVSVPMQRGESTIEEWLRRVAPGYGNSASDGFVDHTDELDFDSLDEGDRIAKERVVTEEYRRQLREEMESFRKVAISVAEIRILEEEDQEKKKSWSSVVAVAAGCLVIGGLCIVFNWFGQAANLLGWPAVGVGVLILIRHLAVWNAVWKRLHSRISTFQSK
ncbi:MAG: hypothetical protein KDA69_11390, partial [Planctomycetaceae bacterium]|nr:hypothetical protein [Planctomycetaceae bacterium]